MDIFFLLKNKICVLMRESVSLLSELSCGPVHVPLCKQKCVFRGS